MLSKTWIGVRIFFKCMTGKLCKICVKLNIICYSSTPQIRSLPHSSSVSPNRKSSQPDVQSVLWIQRRRQSAHLLDEGGEVHRGSGRGAGSGEWHKVRHSAPDRILRVTQRHKAMVHSVPRFIISTEWEYFLSPVVLQQYKTNSWRTFYLAGSEGPTCWTGKHLFIPSYHNINTQQWREL